jgi:hypothetical protein
VKPKAKTIVLTVLAMLALGVSAVPIMHYWREWQLMRQSEPIQAALAEYCKQHGQYPESLAQVGISESLEGPLYYNRISDSLYTLHFGTSLGESRTFHSTDRRWR